MRLQLLADASIDPDNITAGTDCGFETFMGFGNVSHRVAKEKLHEGKAVFRNREREMAKKLGQLTRRYDLLFLEDHPLQS